MTIAVLFMLSFAEGITVLLTRDPDVLYRETRCLQILVFGFPMCAVGTVMIQSLNGAGNTVSPAALSFIGS